MDSAGTPLLHPREATENAATHEVEQKPKVYCYKMLKRTSLNNNNSHTLKTKTSINWKSVTRENYDENELDQLVFKRFYAQDLKT